MENNMNDMINNMKNMIDSGNLPKDVQNLVNNFSSNSQGINNSDINEMLNNLPPDFINNLSNMLNNGSKNSENSGNSSNSSGNSSNSSDNKNNFNIDMNTFLKMKSIMENMNNKNDPRANLLYSLKPYLRDTKKDKLDQYVNLLNMSKIVELMNSNNNNANK